MSAVTLMHGPDARTSNCEYSRVEKQKEVWEQALQIGSLIAERLK